MEPNIWEMQREAARRVERMQQASHRIAAENAFPPPVYRRTAASMRAHRPPPFSPPQVNQNLPHFSQNLPQQSKSACDKEQILLLVLALLLAKNGGSTTLVLALLYLAL